MHRDWYIECGLLSTAFCYHNGVPEVTLIMWKLSRKLRVAITGLSGAGKTVFLTSLLNHLLEGRGLPYLDQAGVSYIAEEETPHSGSLPRFPYEQHLEHLRSEAPAARWPESTTEATSIQLKLTLQSTSRRGRVKVIRLELIDYPGERLVDLPLLTHTYESWSDGVVGAAGMQRREELSREWRGLTSQLLEGRDPSLEELVDGYRSYLLRCEDQGFVYLQPSALVCASCRDGWEDLFCPLPRQVREDYPELVAEFRERFQKYKHEVKSFYKGVICRCSIQVVLVNVLRILENGVASYNETRRCLEQIIRHYAYDPRRWRLDPRRLIDLWRKRIRRVLFVAGQADRCGQDRGNMKYLLEQMINRIRLKLRAQTPREISCHCCAAIRTTTDKEKKNGADTREALCGILEGAVEDGEQDYGVDVQVPSEWPPSWERGEERFGVPQFCPPRLPAREGAVMPHLNLDHVIYSLLEDYLPR